MCGADWECNTNTYTETHLQLTYIWGHRQHYRWICLDAVVKSRLSCRGCQHFVRYTSRSVISKLFQFPVKVSWLHQQLQPNRSQDENVCAHKTGCIHSWTLIIQVLEWINTAVSGQGVLIWVPEDWSDSEKSMLKEWKHNWNSLE